jgi:glutamate/tyrosine decarboxylase-like PLP-dependent enzyme
MKELLADVTGRVIRYKEGLRDRAAFPAKDAVDGLSRLGGELPDEPTDPLEVVHLLDGFGSPATVATTGSRYFGFVVGGTLPATLAANWLAGAWDECGGGTVTSPLTAALEEICLGWLLDVLKLPAGAGGGFVTGATMANFAGLAAARHRLLAKQGWDVEAQGLFGAPPIRVIVGDEVHASLLKALTLVGLGRERVHRVPVDERGRMRADALPELDENTLICIQAGNVNTGAFDPAPEICAAARQAGSWVHVDGAFGLWARATAARAHLAAGCEDADSWSVDAHKWLNVPYESGLVFCRQAEDLRAAMSVTAAYLMPGESRQPSDYTPEMSSKARAIEIWAALRSLGRSGLAEMIERCCRHATRFAAGLSAAGHQILNDVQLNQVLVSFGDPETTRRVIARVQQEGTCWCGGTLWQDRTAMRISVSSWATTDEDVERSLAAILRVAGKTKNSV